MLDFILDLSAGQRRLVYGGIGALIVASYVFWFYFPRSQEIAEIQHKIHELDAERAQLRKTLANRKNIEAESSEVEAAFNKAQAQLPEQKEIPELLRQVSTLGRDSGLEVLLFRQQPEQLRDLYTEVPVQMSVRGGYHHIAMFFDEVRRLDRIVNVADVSMKEPRLIDNRGAQIAVDASFSATTYRFLSEEEREQIAGQKEENQTKRKRK